MQDAPERYRDLLGDDGLAALDKILTRKLDDMPPDSRAALSHVGLALRAMSESLARALGDIDRLVRELARDLDDARPLRAHRPRARRRPPGATTRSSGCSAAWPSTARATTTLREALVIAYLHADQRDDALALLRAELTRAPERAVDGRAARRRG